MGTTLTGTTPQDTYDSLIKVTDNGPLSGTAKYLSDGLGNDSVLALSTSLVGIGTNVPSSYYANNLVVAAGAEGGITIANPATTGAQYIAFADGTSGADRYRGYLNYNHTDNSMVIATDASEKVRITSTGNVGIGTSSPATRLDVSSTSFNVATFRSTFGQMAISFANSGTTFAQLGSGVSVTATGGAADLGFGTAGQANASIVFATGSGFTERFRITNNGVTFNGDTAAANALDDYEEGTWTPNILFGGASVGVTYGGSNGGTYTKVGRKVSVNCYLDISNKGTSTGTAQISNLPFTIGGGASNYGAPSFRPVGITFADFFMGYGDVNGTTITLQQSTALGVVSSLTDTNFGVSTNIIFSFTYFV